MTAEHSARELAHSDRLQTIERARQAVLSGDALAHSIPLEPWVERSWRRCLAQGLQPQQRIAFNTVSALAARHALEAHQPLLRAAEPVIQSLSRAMADSGYFAILTDAQGVVINVNGPIDHHNRLAHLIARVGVDLSEAAVGTTAIGTALSELQPVWLHRGEHFFDATSAYTCVGAPLFGPEGRCVGMLDLTGIHVPERPALKHLVTQSALRIQNALLLAQPHALTLRLNWPDHSLGSDGDGLLCINADGQVIGVNRTAAHMLGLAHAPWPHCSDVFATAPDGLFDAARHQRGAIEIPLWTGLRVQVQALLNDGQAGTRPARMPGLQGMPLKDLETAMIRQAVEAARGNVMQAARTLGISRATVYRKLNRR